jgi:hypothetical protein
MLSPRNPDHGRLWTLAKVAFDKLGVALAELGLAEYDAEHPAEGRR